MLQKNNATPTAKHLVSDSYNKHLEWYEQNIEQIPEGIRVSMDEYKNMLLQAQEQRALHPISMEQYRLSLDQFMNKYKPIHKFDKPKFSGSLISIDDR